MVRVIEMSRERDYILNKLSEHSEEFIDHMLKVFFIPDHDQVRHWIEEIHGYYKRTFRINNKFPDKDTIKECILGDEQELQDTRNSVRDIIYDIEFEYDVEIYADQNDINNSVSFVCDVADWVSDNLSSNGRIYTVPMIKAVTDIARKYDKELFIKKRRGDKEKIK